MVFLVVIAAASAYWARNLVYALRETGELWELRARVAIEHPELLVDEPRYRRVLLVVMTGWEIGMLALMLLQVVVCALGMVGVGPWAPVHGLLWMK
jgi:hypothetical protein